jgi:hypothetical protein
MIQQSASRGKSFSNSRYFDFTAIPKLKTSEMFGAGVSPHMDVEKSQISVYSRCASRVAYFSKRREEETQPEALS